jgi:hypothetical protein
METRSKVKGVPQGIPTTPFVEEVSKTLPPTQGTYLTLCKQQLVEEFPESKCPLSSETTQFHVSTEELEHPVPIHNPTSLKSPKLEPSASIQADDLVQAIKKLGKMKSDTGKLREFEPALRYRFYEGFPPQIKDELSKSKKPQTLQVLKQKVQNIDARYWE